MHTVREAEHEPAGSLLRPGDCGISLAVVVWLGLLTGLLELGAMLGQRALSAQRPTTWLRTNRHFVWMVPVSDALIFAVVGLLLVACARRWPRATRWLGDRLPLGLSFAALLLSVEGLSPLSAAILACGLAVVIGPWLAARMGSLARLVRASLPVLVVASAVLTAVAYQRVVSVERRTLAQCPPAAPGAPNVLLLVLDDVRAASLSLYGHDRPTTPNLERWARRGVVFTEARSTAPWTLPSHASMFTGRWPHELSVGPDVPLDGTFPTLAEVLTRHGYATAGFVGNTRYCNALYGLDRGFARYEDDYENQAVSLFEVAWNSRLGRVVLQALGYPTRVSDGLASLRKTAEMLNRDVLAWLGQRQAGQPYFVFVNYYDAHAPFLPPDGPTPRFGLGALPLAERLAIDERYRAQQAGKPAPSDLMRERTEKEALDLYRDSYESCIAYLDRQVGRLLDELQRRGALDNTLVIVTSDHGEHFGEHGLSGHGLSLYRREVHVPLLVIPPSGRSEAPRVDEPVSLRDIAATVAACAGIGPRSPFPGRSLLGNRADGTPAGHEPDPVLTEVQHITVFPRSPAVPSSLGPVRSLVCWDRVYIRGEGGREELYDLASDPLEAGDLAATPGSRLVLDSFRRELQQMSRR